MKKVIAVSLALIMLSALAACGTGKVKVSDDEFRNKARTYLKGDKFTSTLVEMISDDFTKCDKVDVDIIGGNDVERISEGYMTAPYSLSVTALKGSEVVGKYICVCQVELNEDTGNVTIRFGKQGITIRETAN